MTMNGSLVALVTPMGEDGRLDFDCLGRLLEWHLDNGTDGLVIAGTTGESTTLTRAEHVELIQFAADFVNGRVPVIAGTGSNSTQQTIKLSQDVAGSQIDGYLMVTPYYNKPTQEGLFRHYTAIADAVEKPIILYNVPGRTAVDMLPPTIARLSQHPRIVAVKEATGDVARVAELKSSCDEAFELYSGDDATCREFMLAGGHGVITVTGNVAPAEMAAMCAAALAGQSDDAAVIDARLAALHRDLFVESNPIPVKWALERMGLVPGGIRLPLTPLSDEYRPTVETALASAGVL